MGGSEERMMETCAGNVNKEKIYKFFRFNLGVKGI